MNTGDGRGPQAMPNRSVPAQSAAANGSNPYAAMMHGQGAIDPITAATLGNGMGSVDPRAAATPGHDPRKMMVSGAPESRPVTTAPAVDGYGTQRVVNTGARDPYTAMAGNGVIEPFAAMPNAGPIWVPRAAPTTPNYGGYPPGTVKNAMHSRNPRIAAYARQQAAEHAAYQHMRERTMHQARYRPPPPQFVVVIPPWQQRRHEARHHGMHCGHCHHHGHHSLFLREIDGGGGGSGGGGGGCCLLM